MTRRPFESKAERSRRVELVELIASLSADEMVAYERVEDMLGVDRAVAQSAMRDANESVISRGEPGVSTVPGTGWVKMRAADLLGYNDQRRRRAKRQFRRMGRGVDAAQKQRAKLTQKQRQDLDAQQRVVQRQKEIAERETYQTLDELRRHLESFRAPRY